MSTQLNFAEVCQCDQFLLVWATRDAIVVSIYYQIVSIHFFRHPMVTC